MVKIPMKTTVASEIDDIKCGQVIRTMRTNKGKTSGWLANQMRVHPSVMSELESGKRGWTEARFNRATKILSR